MRHGHLALTVALAAAGLAGCSEDDGLGGIAGGPVPTVTIPAMTTTTVALGPTTTAPATATSPNSPASPSPSPSPTAVQPPAAAPGGLRLGGADLGVTRVGAPFREAVAAVAAALGRPTGDPAPDTSCIGAEDETAWTSFRLAGSGGRVSGWVSSSRTLATPAGVTVGTPLSTLRQVYGARLQVRPPAPDSGFLFIVEGAGLGGTLTGGGGSDTVTSLFNGTCEVV